MEGGFDLHLAKGGGKEERGKEEMEGGRTKPTSSPFFFSALLALLDDHLQILFLVSRAPVLLQPWAESVIQAVLTLSSLAQVVKTRRDETKTRPIQLSASSSGCAHKMPKNEGYIWGAKKESRVLEGEEEQRIEQTASTGNESVQEREERSDAKKKERNNYRRESVRDEAR